MKYYEVTSRQHGEMEPRRNFVAGPCIFFHVHSFPDWFHTADFNESLVVTRVQKQQKPFCLASETMLRRAAAGGRVWRVARPVFDQLLSWVLLK